MPAVVVGEERYEFVEEDLTNVELIDIEKETDLTAVEFFQKINRGSMLAMTALVWILRRRTEPALQFKDVKFAASTFEIDNSDVQGKSRPADTARTSRTRSTTTSSPSRSTSASTPGTSGA